MTASASRTALVEAYLAIEALEARLEAAEQAGREPIAIVGMGCRFPGGADDPASFWRRLRSGADALGEIPSGRWDVDAFYDPDSEAIGKMYVRHGFYLPDVDLFDAHFFGISPREANGMDPQQRLLLEVAWEALEDAGIAADSLTGSSTGVYVGLLSNDYLRCQMPVAHPQVADAHTATGTGFSFGAGRLSYVLGLQGPSLVVNTACSSSLVTAHLACQALREGECDLALAGGVNLILSPDSSIIMSRVRALSPDGRSRTFDASADGYGRGEGCGMLVLKRLQDARRDGDQVLALIRGAAVNHGGRSGGLTVPSGPAQERLLSRAFERAGVAADDIGYIEAHGTATTLGDPIEIRAIASVMGERRDRPPVYVGSVKTGIGHLEGAAGVAGLIKTVLSLQHREIPPHLHLQEPNPHIPWAELPLEVATELTPWPASERPRMAGVSAFGLSGINAHVVLEEAPLEQDAEAAEALPERSTHLLRLTAHSEAALRELASRTRQRVESARDVSLADLCHSASRGRSELPQRLAVRAGSSEELVEQLAAFERSDPAPGVATGRAAAQDAPRVAFLFTGQGAQYVGMGRQLYDTEPVFREVVERCDRLLASHLERPLLSVLYPSDDAELAIDQTAYTQPAMFALQMGLVELWRSWGIEPTAVLGHSVGEFAAAVTAGAMDFEDGLLLIAERGRLMQELPAGGAMLSARISEARALELVADQAEHLSIAAINGPESVVLSGDREPLVEIADQLAGEDIKVRWLEVSHAFHSPRMEPMLEALSSKAAEVTISTPHIDLISNLTGGPATAELLSSGSYWSRHARQPVRFASSVEWLAESGYELLLEIGPRPTLLGMARAVMPDGQGEFLPSLRQGKDDSKQMLTSLGTLYSVGVDVDWQGLDDARLRRRVKLPTYPFERQRYWFRDLQGPVGHGRGDCIDPLLGWRVQAPLLDQVLFTSQLAADLPWVSDHRVFGELMVPGACLLSMMLSAGREVHDGADCELRDVSFSQALVLPEGTVADVQIVLSGGGAEGWRCQLLSLGERPEDWQLHCSARLVAAQGKDPSACDLEALRQGVEGERRDLAALYRRTWEGGFELGGSLRWIEEMWAEPLQGIGRLRAPQSPQEAREVEAFVLHPSWLDSCFQLLSEVVPKTEDGFELYVPTGLDQLRVYRQPTSSLWIHAALRPDTDLDPETVVGDFRLIDANGELVAEVSGMAARRMSREAMMRAHGKGVAEWLYELSWPVDPHRLDAGEVDLLAWTRALDANVATWSREAELDVFAELRPAINELATRYFQSALRRLGWNGTLSEAGDTAVWAEQLGVVEAHQRLLGRVGDLLVDAAEEHESHGENGAGVSGNGHSATALQLAEQYPGFRSELEMVSRCGEGLVGVLQGKTDALELLFPSGSLETARRVYQSSPRAKVFNRLIGDLVEKFVDSLPANRKIRVLEIGAGTGGTTVAVLERLPADRSELVYTDLSALFESAAHELRSEYSFIDYRLLDIERDPAEQGFETRTFDLVVASNVLHATRDIRSSLRHARQLMAPGGLLLLMEGTGPEPWLDVVFGLTPGWWRFSDGAERPDYPLMSSSKWQEILAQEGFEEVASVPRGGEGGGGLYQQVVLAARAPSAELATSDRWLIVGDADDLGERLAAHLEALGAQPVRVAGDGSQIRQELASEAESFRGAIYLAGLAVSELDEEDAELSALHAGQQAACEGLLHLVQAASSLTAPVPLWIVTRGAVVLDGDESMARGLQATLWGIGRVLGAESSDLLGGMVDLDPASTATDPEQIVSELMADDSEVQVCWRDGHRHLARLTRVTGEPTAEAVAMRSDASYLITGGLGALGLEVARWLVERGARHLVLLGRGAASEAAERSVGELRKLGVEVQIVQGDVADPESLASTVSAIEPPLRGVIHSAGVLDDQLLTQLEWQSFERVLAPKVAGGWNLHRATRDQELDFFVLFSSAASLLGSLGQGNYAAGNAFLDHLAASRRAQQLPATSINWGPWAEIGLAAAMGEREQERLAALGMGSIPPDLGLVALQEALARDLSQVGVLPIDWPRFLEGQRSGIKLFSEFEAAGQHEGPSESSSGLLQQWLAADDEARQAMLAEAVQQAARQVLDLESSFVLDDSQSLFELGMDSLMALELRNRLEALVGSSLSSSLIFNYPSVDKLVEHLTDEMLAREAPADTAGAESRAPGSASDASESLSGQAQDPESKDTLSDLSEAQLLELLADELADGDESSREVAS
ncbi:MAG: SDR family NAD(P)-dependent oxidoreductase [Acidobacteriota bacterium]